MSKKEEVRNLLKQASELIKKQARETGQYIDVSELKKLASKRKGDN